MEADQEIAIFFLLFKSWRICMEHGRWNDSIASKYVNIIHFKGKVIPAISDRLEAVWLTNTLGQGNSDHGNTNHIFSSVCEGSHTIDQMILWEDFKIFG